MNYHEYSPQFNIRGEKEREDKGDEVEEDEEGEDWWRKQEKTRRDEEDAWWLTRGM